MKSFRAGICSRSDRTSGLSRLKCVLSNVFWITCWMPFPSWQLTDGGGGPIEATERPLPGAPALTTPATRAAAASTTPSRRNAFVATRETGRLRVIPFPLKSWIDVDLAMLGAPGSPLGCAPAKILRDFGEAAVLGPVGEAGTGPTRGTEARN